MDYFDILISVNKISIFFFVITVLFILYEFYLYNKERGRSKNIPVKIPDIEEAPKLTLNASPLKQMSDEKPPQVAKKPNNKFLIIGSIAVFVFGLIFFISYVYILRQRTQDEQTRVSPTTKPTATATPTTSPTRTPTPTVSIISEEEPTPASPSPTIEEIVVAEVSPTETPSVEEEQIPAAGSAFYPLFIFAASAVLILVAFVL